MKERQSEWTDAALLQPWHMIGLLARSLRRVATTEPASSSAESAGVPAVTVIYMPLRPSGDPQRSYIPIRRRLLPTEPRQIRVSIHAATAAIILLLFASPVYAQPAFPVRGMEIINALYAGVNPQDDDARKIKILRTCEQFAYDLGTRWGGKKRAGLGDEFRSPDSIAFFEDDGSVSVWDIQASSGAILVHAGKPPDYPKLPSSEAAFMPCAQVNHLGAPSPGPIEPNPGPAPAPVDLSGLEQKIDALAADLAKHEAAEAEFRAAAKGIWEHYFKPFLVFTTKYIMPAAVAFLAGREVTQ